MHAIRITHSSTQRNLDSILDLLQDPAMRRVTLFASPAHSTPEMSATDGGVANLPLVAALVHLSPPVGAPITVILDGYFLTAARTSQAAEVSELLDTALASGKAFVASSRAPFTSYLSPDAAVTELRQISNLTPLTSLTRASFFRLLSREPEMSVA